MQNLQRERLQLVVVRTVVQHEQRLLLQYLVHDQRGAIRLVPRPRAHAQQRVDDRQHQHAPQQVRQRDQDQTRVLAPQPEDHLRLEEEAEQHDDEGDGDERDDLQRVDVVAPLGQLEQRLVLLENRVHVRVHVFRQAGELLLLGGGGGFLIRLVEGVDLTKGEIDFSIPMTCL